MTAQLQIDLAPGRLLPLVRCVDCGVDLGEHALGNLCVPCQKVWRVKRIRITPDWSAKQMRAGATAPQAGSRSGVSSADHAPSSPIPPRIIDGKKRWANQTDSGQNKLAPSADRWKIRSTTYAGIAAAMASQWSPKIIGNNTCAIPKNIGV